MPSSRPAFRSLPPLAAFYKESLGAVSHAWLAFPLLACCCLAGCLFSWGGKDDGEAVPVVEEKPREGRGYYTIPRPAASSRLHLDSTYIVQWRASDSAPDGPVRISLYRNDSSMGTVVQSLQDSGLLDWNLADMRSLGDYRLGSGTGYRLRVMNEADSSKWDFGPRFSLYSHYSGTLTLTAPTPGSTTREDSTLRIAWNLTGNVGNVVGVQLYRGAAPVENLMTIFVPAAEGGYSWTDVPEWLASGDDYRIRIFSMSDPAIGQLGQAFTLSIPDWAGTYEVLRPAAGDIWMAGGLAEVEFRFTGNPGSFTLVTLWRDSPREHIMGWTPGETTDTLRLANVPENLKTGSYRIRLSSLVDTTLFAFSSPFLIQEIQSP